MNSKLRKIINPKPDDEDNLDNEWAQPNTSDFELNIPGLNEF